VGVGGSEVKRPRNMKTPPGARRGDLKEVGEYKKNAKRKIIRGKKKRNKGKKRT